MNSTYSINPRRLLLLIRSSIFINRNLILILTAVFSAMIILIAVKDTFTREYTNLYQNMYLLLLFVSGFSVTWGISGELKDKRKSGSWLLLPASMLEKFLSILLLPTLFIICGTAVYMTVLSLLVEAGLGLIAGSYHKIFNPFNNGMLSTIIVYIAIQSSFFFGALYFKKNKFSFTFLSLFIYSVILVIFTLVAGKLVLNEHIAPLADMTGGLNNTNKMFFMTLAETLRKFGSIWGPVMVVLASYVYPLVYWIAAFFSLKEMEQ
jgi:hypothetical protein